MAGVSTAAAMTPVLSWLSKTSHDNKHDLNAELAVKLFYYYTFPLVIASFRPVASGSVASSDAGVKEKCLLYFSP